MNLMDLYDRLLGRFGNQGWWPLVIDKTPVYFPRDYSRPKSDFESFEIASGAILVQNVNWKNAQSAVLNLWREELLNPDLISKMPVEKLEVLIRASGFYRQKAKRLQNLASKWSEVKRYSKKSNEVFREYLLSLNGVGKETADSISLYAFKKPVFMIDSYTKRFSEREGLLSSKFEYDVYKSFYESNLPRDYKLYNEFHALIVRNEQEHKKIASNSD